MINDRAADILWSIVYMGKINMDYHQKRSVFSCSKKDHHKTLQYKGRQISMEFYGPKDAYLMFKRILKRQKKNES